MTTNLQNLFSGCRRPCNESQTAHLTAFPPAQLVPTQWSRAKS